MAIKYTREAEQAIKLASDESKKTDHAFIGTEQLLLGIVTQANNKTAALLKKMGVDVENARHETMRIIGQNGNAGGAEKGYTPRTKAALKYAADHATEAGAIEVDTNHILLGILQEGEGVAPVLQNLSVDISKLRTDLVGLN